MFPLPGIAQIPNLSFKHLTPKDGLTQGVIHSVYTDTKGFVWMTGMDGINRFDGSHCLGNNEIAPGLKNPGRTNQTIEDKNGDIWIGNPEGLIRYSYRSNQFTQQHLSKIPGDNDDVGNNIPLASDLENNLLIGNDHSTSVTLYNTGTNKYKYYEPPVENIQSSACMYFPPGNKSLKKGWHWVLHSNDSMWLCTLSGEKAGKPIWKKRGFAWKDEVSKALLMPDENTLFFYSKEHIYKYHFTTGNIACSPTIPSSYGTIYLIPDVKGRLWVSGSKNGLQLLDTASMQILSQHIYSNENSNGISSNDVYAFIDRNQILWLVAWGKGVDYANLEEEKFSSFLTADEAKASGFSNFIRGITEAPDGRFFCSTQSGILMLDKNLQFIKMLPGSQSSFQYPDIYLQQNKLYYVSDAAGGGGLYQYDLGSGIIKRIFVNEESKVFDFPVYQLCKSNSKALLLSTLNKGLLTFNIDEQKIEALPGITMNDAIEQEVVCSYQDKQQQIYKCFSRNGFIVYRKTANEYKPVFNFNKYLRVKHITPLNDSLLWMGTSDGLYLFNSIQLKMIEHFTTEDGLPNNVVYAIMPVEKNNLWLSTNKGISYFNTSTNSFTNFTMEDGLQGNEFNTHAVITATDGRIIFGGVNGLTVVNPNVISYKPSPPVLQITAIKSDSIYNPFPYNEKGAVFVLNAGVNSFETVFTAIDVSNPILCKIKYRLTGYDNTWQLTTNPGVARYTKLPPGKYVLEIMASNIRGDFSADVKQLTLIVESYWWQKGWFKVTVILLLLISATILIRQYIKRKMYVQKLLLEKKLAVANERERIIADLHDDVGATLSSMNIYGDLADSIWDTKPQESRKMIEKISVTTKDLMNRMGDIIWSMKPADEEKYTLEARLKNYSNEILSPGNIVCDFDIDGKLVAAITNPEVRKNILLIAKEAINNLAKYSEASKAFVSLKHENEIVLLTISDNGKGYEEENISHGNGLQNMQQRCKLLRGTCIFKPVMGAGVTITCSFPIAIIRHTT
ncbi:MAG: two-component regulator propeller domain-containing protein [Ferruginibacter sp.]